MSFVAELAAGALAVELPLNADLIPIHALVPRLRLAAQGTEIRDSSLAQALAREDPDFDFRLIQPTAVGRRVMDGEAVPDLRGHLIAENVRQALSSMDVEIVHHQVNRFGVRIGERQIEDYLGEFEAGTVRCRVGEMTSGFRLYRAENIGGTAPLVLVVAARFTSRLGRRGRPHIGMQRNRLLVHTNHRLFRIVRRFVVFQDLFFFGDVVLVEFGRCCCFFRGMA